MKQYYVQPSADKAGQMFDEEQFEKGIDAFRTKYPDAVVTTIRDYDDEDEIDDNSTYIVNVGESSKEITGDKFRAGKDSFMAKYPDAKVQVVQSVDLNERAAHRMEEQMQAMDEANTPAFEEYEYHKSIADNAKLSEKERQASMDFVLQHDKEYNTLKAERAALQQQYDNNPYVLQQQRNYSNQNVDELQNEINSLQAEYDKLVQKDKAELSNPSAETRRLKIASFLPMSGTATSMSTQGQRYNLEDEVSKNITKTYEDKQNIRAAQQLLKESQNLYTADKKSDEDSSNLGAMFRGLKDKTGDAEFWNTVAAAENGSALNSLHNKIMDLVSTYNNVGEAEAEKILDEKLSDSEKALLDAYMRMGQAQEDNQDIRGWYKAGGVAAESLMFMAEFLAGGDIVGAATSGITKAIAKKGAKLAMKATSKVGRAVAKGGAKFAVSNMRAMVGGAVQTAVSPSTIVRVQESMNTINDNGELVDATEGAIAGLVDAYIENSSEFGLGVVNHLGAMGAKALNRTIRNLPFGSLYTPQIGEVMKRAGVGGFLEETGEEINGAIIRTLLGKITDNKVGNEEEWKEFWTPDNLGILVASFAPTIGGGAILSEGVRAYYKVSANKKENKLRETLSNAGYSNEVIDAFFNAASADSPKVMVTQMSPYIQQFVSNEADANIKGEVLNYISARASANEVAAREEKDRDADRTARMGKIEEEMQGQQWWHTTETDKGTIQRVRRIETADGRVGYIVSGNEKDGWTVNYADGRGGFISEAEIQQGVANGTIYDTGFTTRDQHLDIENTRRRGELERERMRQQEADNRNALSQAMLPGSKINMGTEEDPIEGVVNTKDADGWTIIMPDETRRHINEEEASRILGIPLKAKTDAEIAEEEADLIDERMERVAQLNERKGNVITRGGNDFILEGVVFSDGKYRAAVRDVNGVQSDIDLTDDEVALLETTQTVMVTPGVSIEDTDEQTDNVDTTTPPATDTQLPTDANGKVDQTTLWNENPERWAEYNDTRRGKADTRQYIALAINKQTERIAAIDAALQTETDFDNRDALYDEKEKEESRLATLQALQRKYEEEIQVTPNVEAPTARSEGVESPSPAAEKEEVARRAEQDRREDTKTNNTSLLDVVSTLYSKGKEVASKLFQRSFFDVAQTPKFMQELGLRGDKFTVKYGVIARHFGKDGSHDLTERDWEQLPQALQNPFAISKLTDKTDSYRIYTALQTESGEFVVVGVDVKNAGREIEVNAISTVFGRRNNANLSKNEEVIYRSKEITPEQSSLLERPNFAQYPTEQEFSEGKDTNSSETSNTVEEKNKKKNTTFVEQKKKDSKKKTQKKPSTPTHRRDRYADELNAMGEYLNFRDFVLRYFAGGGRLAWTDNGPIKGLASHLGLKRSKKEYNKRIWLIASNAMHPERAAEELRLLYAQEVAPWIEDLEEVLPIDEAFNEMMDVLQSHDKPSSMLAELREMHSRGSEYDQAQEEYYKQEAFYDAYHMSEEEYALREEVLQEQYEADASIHTERERYFDDLRAEESEQINNADNGRSEKTGDKTVDERVLERQEQSGSSQRSNEVLSETQPNSENGDRQRADARTEVGVNEESSDNLSTQSADRRSRADGQSAAIVETRSKGGVLYNAVVNHIQDWAGKLGVQIEIVERFEDLTNNEAIAQVQLGSYMPGFYETNTGKVVLYMPHLMSRAYDPIKEVDNTIIHEVVAHKGLRKMLGEKQYKKLCERVFDAASLATQERFMNYPGVNGRKHAAGDEMIAHFAENKELTEEERTLWQKIVDFVRNLLGIAPTNEDLERLIRQSYTELINNGSQSNEQTTEEGNRYKVYRSRDGKETRFTQLSLQFGGDTAINDGSGPANVQREGNTTLTTLNTLRKLEEGEVCNVERIFTESKEFNFTRGEKIESADDVAYIFKSLEDEAIENAFVALVKDGEVTVIHLGMGGQVSTPLDFTAAITAANRIKPEKVYFIHNHPSGNLHCSRPDMEALGNLGKALGDIVQEGIIINTRSGQYGTFNYKDGNIDTLDIPANQDSFPLKVYKFNKQAFKNDITRVTPSSESIAEFVSTQRLGSRNKINALLLNNLFECVGNVFLTETEITSANADRVARKLIADATAMDARGVVLYGRSPMVTVSGMGSNIVLSEKVAQMSDKNIQLFDVIQIDDSVRRSAADYGVRFRTTIAPEVREEMESIKADAIANGTFLKAPNNKDTNLNEEQWLMVRTSNFKKWFGDWMKAARIEKLRKSKAIDVDYNNEYELNRESAKSWMKDNLRGEYTNADTGEVVLVTKVGSNKVTSHGERDEAHLKSIIAIPSLIENSIFIEEQKNEKDNDRYDSYRYYVCGAKIDGEDYTVKVVIGVKGDSKYYDHRLTQIEKGTLIDNLNGMANPVAENQNANNSMGKDSKLISILQTNSSKVVDENGEPMVVYHGSPYKFTKFNPNRIGYSTGTADGRGFYFTTDKTFAEAYKTAEGELYQVFLNIKNPLDYNKLSITKSQLKSIISDMDKTEVEQKGEHYFILNYEDYTRVGVNKAIQEATNLEYEYAENDIELINSIIGASGDFTLVMDSVEKVTGKGSLISPKANGTTHYIVTSPNQIKSATDDNGEFSTENDDIRFRFIGERGARNLDKAEEATTRLGNLAVAREMEGAGKDAKAIKLATGWERGADGKWRYEAEDNFDLTELENRLQENLDDGLSKTWGIVYPSDLGDLTKAYPDFNVDIMVWVGEEFENTGEYSPATEGDETTFGKPASIEVKAKTVADIKGVLVHEIQHAIQEIEGFAEGGSVFGLKDKLSSELDKRAARIKELRAEGRDAEADELMRMSKGLAEAVINNEEYIYQNYRKLAGEVEARNATKRMDMSAVQKLNTLLEETEDVAREDQIILTQAVLDAYNTRFRVANENQEIFVSNAQRAVESIKQDKATPQQWLAMITKQGGLKAGEDKWLGLSDWLKFSDTKTITKQEILDFIAENKIQIEEVHYSQFGYGLIDEAARNIEKEVKVIGWEEVQNKYPGIEEYFELDRGEVLWSTLNASIGEYEDFIIDNKIVDVNPQNNAINETREQYTTEGLNKKREIALTVPTIESWNRSDEVHFGDAGDGRAIAWVRFGETKITEEGSLMEYEPKNDVEREIKDYIEMGMNKWGYSFEECVDYAYNQITDAPQESVGWTKEAVKAVAEGMRGKARRRKVLVIDEIQSKRHQEGREKGYSIELAKVKEAENKWAEWYSKMSEKYGPWPKKESLTKEEQDEGDKLSKDIDEVHSLYMQNRDGVPDAPFDKNWHEIAMKRMLRLAAEEGYDYVAWTKGEQQAKRYNIGGVVKRITSESYGLDDNGDVIRLISITLKGEKDNIRLEVDKNGLVIDGDANYEGKHLNEIVGKDMAVRLMARDIEMSGDNLRIGGEGMKGFYDKMLPSFVSKYTKKWGAKVEDIELPQLEESARVMHSVNITPEMKESVIQGQTMFRIGNNEQTHSRTQWQEPPVKVMELLEGMTGKTREQLIEEYAPKEVIRFRTDFPENRHEGESAEAFFGRVLEYYKNHYNVITNTAMVNLEVADVTDRLREVFGMSEEDARALVERYKDKKTLGLFINKYNAATIFVRPNASSAYEVMETIFHENLHAFLYEYLNNLPKDDSVLYEYGIFVNDIINRLRAEVDYLARTDELAKERIAFLDKAGSKEEYITYTIANGMANNNVMKWMSALSHSQQELFNDFFDRIGYETEWQTSDRRISNERGSATHPGRNDGRETYSAKRDHARAISERLGVEIEIVSKADMPKGHEESMGVWRNGKIFICPANIPNADEAVRTVLHEAVGHEGLRKLVGAENMTNFCMDLYRRLPKSRRAIIELSRNKHGWNIEEAVEEYLAEKAQDFNLDSEETRNLWDVIVEALRGLLSKIGINVPLSERDVRWLVYQSAKALDHNFMTELARATLAHKLGFSLRAQAVRAEAQDIIRDRQVEEDTRFSASRGYNREVSLWSSRLRETFVDMHDSVSRLMEAIEDATGKEAEKFEDIRIALTQMSSKGLAEMEQWERKYWDPIKDIIRKIVNETGQSVDDIQRYMMLKHALERNEKLAARDAKKQRRQEFENEKTRINNDASLTDAQKQAQIAAADATLKAQLIDIDNKVDAVYKDNREKDYGGLTGMYTDYGQVGVYDKTIESLEEYQQRLHNARRKKYKTVAAMEKAAMAEVAAYENAIGTNNITELWKRINAATKATLHKQYTSNMISRSQYEQVRDMFEYYVPLRGFAENTAEDLFDYYSRAEATNYSKPMLSAGGRESMADSPLGYIGSMASSAIAEGVKNEAKLTLYYFASNRAGNDLITMSDTWYEYIFDNNGKKIGVTPVYPPFTEELSTDAAKQAYEQWENDMKQKQAAGLAVKGTRKARKMGLDYVIQQSKNQAQSHIIKVRVLGEEKFLFINGNPRAAQAINNELNVEVANDYQEYFGKALRFLSGVNTQYNPEFWISNFQRDILFALMSVDIKEDRAYNRAYRQNLIKAIKVFKMKKDYESGKVPTSAEEAYYKEYVDNGGVTGYTYIKGNEEWEAQIRKLGLSSKEENILTSTFKGIEHIGNSIEQISRFAAYMTSRQMGRDVRTSISNAKELTVNFNRKGSGKTISWEETDKLRKKNGKKLNNFERALVVMLSLLSAGGRRFFMFFNASIQGLNAAYQLAKDNKAKAAKWAGMYFALGAMQAVVHGLIDDDDEEGQYLDRPDYERRNNALIGVNGHYFKWALPQEMRFFYGLGDIIYNQIAGRSPHKNILGEIGMSMLDILPINPAAGISAVVPSVVSPLVEVMINEDFKGAKIYNDMPWLSDEEKKRMPEYQKAFRSTGSLYVNISKLLNDISGGDETTSGIIDFNPAKVEHIIEGYLGGALTTASRLYRSTIGQLFGEELNVSNIPFLNRVWVVSDDRSRNAYVNEVYDYYKAEAEHTDTRISKYEKMKNSESLKEIKESYDYKVLKIYEKYEKKIKTYNDMLKKTEDYDERKQLMREQDAIKRKMIKEISELK